MELSSGGLQAAGWVLESQQGVAGGRWGTVSSLMVAPDEPTCRERPKMPPNMQFIENSQEKTFYF